ncbi:MAG: triphosphoribosyl-dephospho-CoA synthase [Sedimenticola sp.]|nr:triphosphoribosyl-dephospho-CoA synthase [Sedimenticola sp.]
MNPVTTSYLEASYLAACAMDVTALKPGNVSRYSPGHGMDAELFIQSAQVSAKVIAKPGAVLGKRIYDAVNATMTAVGCNTNLGIVLLCAPILQAVIDYPGERIDRALIKVLHGVGIDETNWVFSAICLANPGGLGESDSNDVKGAATTSLVEVMAVAAGRDLIAQQYANGFRELRSVALPFLAAAVDRYGNEEAAVTDLFLYLLTRYNDSHIRRKHGLKCAMRVSRLAANVYQQYRDAADEDVRHGLLTEMDRLLKQKGINPGTTADFCVAGVLIHRLQKAGDQHHRGYPELSADNKANTGLNTANTLSQQSEEIRYGSY